MCCSLPSSTLHSVGTPLSVRFTRLRWLVPPNLAQSGRRWPDSFLPSPAFLSSPAGVSGGLGEPPTGVQPVVARAAEQSAAARAASQRRETERECITWFLFRSIPAGVP